MTHPPGDCLSLFAYSHSCIWNSLFSYSLPYSWTINAFDIFWFRSCVNPLQSKFIYDVELQYSDALAGASSHGQKVSVWYASLRTSSLDRVIERTKSANSFAKNLEVESINRWTINAKALQHHAQLWMFNLLAWSRFRWGFELSTEPQISVLDYNWSAKFHNTFNSEKATDKGYEIVTYKEKQSHPKGVSNSI